MTDTKRLNGKSIAQHKKDAKRLSELQNQPLFKSLDFIARSLGYSSWAKAMSMLENNVNATPVDELNYCIPGDSSLTLTLSTNAPAGFIFGPTGSGKTLLLRHMSYEYLKAGKDLVILRFSQVNDHNQIVSIQNGRLITFVLNAQNEKVHLEDIMSLHQNSIILVDELWAFNNLVVPSDLGELKKICNEHGCFFIGSSQIPTDIPALSPSLHYPSPDLTKGINKRVPRASFILQYDYRERSTPIHLLGIIEKGDFKNHFRLTADKYLFRAEGEGGADCSGILHLQESQINSSKAVFIL